MRQVFLILMSIFGFVSIAYSRIDKGSVMIGGNAGFQFKKTEKAFTEIQFSISPLALYHPIKYIGVGGQISYLHYYTKRAEPSQTIVSAQNVFGIGPVFRVNISIGKKAFLFINHGFTGGVNVTRDPTDRDKSYYSYSVISWRFGPGFSIFAKKPVAVEFGFYYEGMKSILSIKQNKTVLLKGAPSFTHGLTVSVGLQFYLHKKKKIPAIIP